MLKNIALCLGAVLLAALPWFNYLLAPLILFSFVPLLIAESRLGQSAKAYPNLRWLVLSLSFGYGWYGLVMLSQGFDYISWLVYGFTLSLALLLFRFVKKSLGQQRGYIALPFLWISAEALHFYKDFGALPVPLAKAFQNFEVLANFTNWIGQFGTGLWIVAINIFIFLIVSGFLKHRQWKPLVGQSVLLVLLVVLAPVLLSPSPEEARQGDTELVADGFAGNTISKERDPRLINSRIDSQISPSDRFVARMSFFIAGFLLLFTFVKSYLDKNQIVKNHD